MTELHLNPMYYLKHAWDNTHSAWGKITIVSFYVFIWFQIIWAVQVIIAPTWLWECAYASMNEYTLAISKMFARSASVVTIGFFLYADRGGIKVWNVMMVFLVFGASVWITMGPDYAAMKGAPKQCELKGWTICFWAQLGWIFLTLICAFMESRSASRASRGTAEERAPLV